MTLPSRITMAIVRRAEISSNGTGPVSQLSGLQLSQPLRSQSGRPSDGLGAPLVADFMTSMLLMPAWL